MKIDLRKKQTNKWADKCAGNWSEIAGTRHLAAVLWSLLLGLLLISQLDNWTETYKNEFSGNFFLSKKFFFRGKLSAAGSLKLDARAPVDGARAKRKTEPAAQFSGRNNEINEQTFRQGRKWIIDTWLTPTWLHFFRDWSGANALGRPFLTTRNPVLVCVTFPIAMTKARNREKFKDSRTPGSTSFAWNSSKNVQKFFLKKIQKERTIECVATFHSNAPPLIVSNYFRPKKKKKSHLRWLCCHLHETSGGAGGCASIYPSRFFIHSRLMRQLLTAPTGGERLVPPLLSDKFTSIIAQLQQLETRRPAFQKFLPNFNFKTHQPAHHSIA